MKEACGMGVSCCLRRQATMPEIWVLMQCMAQTDLGFRSTSPAYCWVALFAIMMMELVPFLCLWYVAFP